MNKTEFFMLLDQRLAGLPDGDLEHFFDYYNEMIDDRMEEGMTEEEAVAALGSVDEIVNQILDETSLFKLLHKKIKPKRKLCAWEIVLIALGFPMWFSLLLSVAVVFFSVYVSIWSVVAALYAAGVSIAAGGVCGLFCGPLYMFFGSGAFGAMLLGSGFFLAGFSIFWAFGCQYAAKAMIRLGKCLLLGTKALLLGKEGAK